MKPLLLTLAILTAFAAGCQPITISGRVINEESDPVPGATILVKGTTKTAIADANGYFIIKEALFDDTLVVSAIGYETAEDLNNARGLVTIVLKKKITSLNEVIINTGYQELSKERTTGSFEKLDTRLLSRRVSNDWLSRLEGVSSVYFDRRGITSGGISIRGRSTIFANAAPLIIVDNFPYDGDINNINPNDIESITVLKDAATSSIWGVRAGNGVIVVVTKKGKYRKPPSLQLNMNVTIGNKPDLFYAPLLNSTDFIDVETFLFGKGFYNGDISNTTNRPPLSPVVEILAKRRSGTITPADSAAQINALKNFDYRNDLDKYFYRRSLAQQYAINYSGGAENINYFLSAGYDNIDPNLINNNTERITISSGASYTPFQKLEFGITFYHTQSHTRSGNPANNVTVGSSKSLYPYAQLADAYGNPLPTVKDYRYAFIDTAGGGKLLDWKYRPLQEVYEANNRLAQYDTRFNLKTTFRFNNHFSADLLYQYERQTQERKNSYSQNTYLSRNLINRYYNASANKYAIPLGGIIDQQNASLLSHSARLQANYRQSFQLHHELAVIAGVEVRQTETVSSSSRFYGYNDDILTYTNVNFIDNQPIYANLSSAQLIPNPAAFSGSLLRFVSLYSNAAYTYNKKYTISLSARKDASNLFGVSSNQKWVPLWSTGFSWQLNKENFYKLSWLPLLKLRVTYGYNGNVDNSLSAFTTIRYSTGAMFTSQQYATVQNPPNPELRWEKNAMLNIGLDFGFKNDRISGTIEYFKKHGKDLIGFSPVDPTTGVLSNTLTFSYKGNVADMKGDGVELAVNTENLVGSFQWSTTLLFNYMRTEVTKYQLTNFNASSYLNEGAAITPVPGKPVFAIYSYAWAGLDPATGDPQGILNGNISKDYTALTGVTVNNLVYNGPSVPEIFGSLRNSFAWKRFSLSANIVWKAAYYFRRPSVNYTTLFTNWIGHPDYAARWQKPGDEKFTYIPSLIYPNSNSSRDNFFTTSQVLVQKGDHIRLQDISFSYEILPTGKKSFFKNIQVYAYMNNVGILWKANNAGIDPDYFNGGYPLPLSISFGLKSTF